MYKRTYLAIDLKSYYASAECAARHLDPLTTNLVVADSSRTEKTICLAVSPSLKAYGIPGRARLFEVVQKVKEVEFVVQHLLDDGTICSRADNNIAIFNRLSILYIYQIAIMILWFHTCTGYTNQRISRFVVWNLFVENQQEIIIIKIWSKNI